MNANPVGHLIDAVADAQRRRATEPTVYRVVRRGKPTSANWTVELAGIPAGLVGQARGVATRGNREAGFPAYDVWSW